MTCDFNVACWRKLLCYSIPGQHEVEISNPTVCYPHLLPINDPLIALKLRLSSLQIGSNLYFAELRGTFFTAFVLIPATSDPAPGSVTPYAHIIGSSINRVRYFFFCSSLPASLIGMAPNLKHFCFSLSQLEIYRWILFILEQCYLTRWPQ